jgi:hypothetical protein
VVLAELLERSVIELKRYGDEKCFERAERLMELKALVECFHSQ